MKSIKSHLTLITSAILAAAAPLVLFTFISTAPIAMTGCSALSGTNGISDSEISSAALILQNAARVGALAAIAPPAGDTNNIAYFTLASQAIGTFLTGNDYTPAAFQSALIAVKAPGSDNLWVQLALGTVIDLYQVYFSQYVTGNVNANFATVSFLTAVQNGFNQAAGLPTTPLPQPPSSTAATLTLANLRASPVILPRPLK